MSRDNRTALVETVNIDIVSLLLNYGANVKAMKMSVLIMTTSPSNIDIASLLDRVADVNMRIGFWGETTALIQGVSKGNTDIVLWLLAQGADVNMMDGMNRNALISRGYRHCAVDGGK